MREREHLVLLMDANARTERGGGKGLGNEARKVLGAHGDTLNDNDKRLIVFSTNYDLSMLNTFSGTPESGTYHTFNGRCKKRIACVLTRQRGRRLMRDDTVQPQLSFLPISNHNVVRAHPKLLSHFARNRPVRRVNKPPPIDQQWLSNHPHLRQKVDMEIALGSLLHNGRIVDSRGGCTVATTQASGARMEGRRPGGSRAQHCVMIAR